MGFWVFLLFLTAAGYSCSFGKPDHRPSPSSSQPSPRHQITDQDVQTMMQQMMGKTPVEETPRTTDGVQVVIQQGHTGIIQAVAMSPDGRYAISGGMDETAKLWDLASGQEIQSFSGFGMMGPRYLAFSDDSQTVIVADMQTVKVFDVSTGRELRTVEPFIVERLAISGNGQWMAVSGRHLQRNKSRRTLEVLKLATGQTAPPLPDSEDHSPLAINQNGRILITQRTEDDGELVLWDLASRRSIRELGESSKVWLAALSPDGTILATQDLDDGTLTVRNTQAGDILYTKDAPDPDNPGGINMTFSPNGRWLALSFFSRPAQILEARSGEVQTEIIATAVNFSPDNRQLIIGKPPNGAPILVDRESGKETLISRSTSAVQEFSLTADGHTLIVSMSDGSAKIWNLITGEITGLIEGPSPFASVSVMPNGQLVATGGLHGAVSIWNLASRRLVKQLRQDDPVHQHDPSQFQSALVRFTPDGRTLAVGIGKEVRLWDTNTWEPRWVDTVPLKSWAIGSLITPSPDSPKGIQQMTFSPDGRLLAISTGGFAGVWDSETGEDLYAIGGGGMRSLFDLTFSSGSRNSRPAMNNPLDLHNQLVGVRDIKTLAFNPNGTLLFSVGMMGKQFWETGSGRQIPLEVPSLGASPDPKQAVKGFEVNMSKGGAFRPDGKMVAYSHGRGIKFLDLETKQEHPPLSGHTSDLTALAYSPDGRFLISGAKDGAIRLWDAHTGKEQISLLAIGRDDYVAVTHDQYYRLSKPGIKGVAFRVDGTLYPFDQFDLRFNRPDIILDRLGQASPRLIHSYRQAYEKRLRKMGLTQERLGTDMHLPEVEITNRTVPGSVTTSTLSLHINARDTAYPLDRLNVYVNDVPIHGTAGLPFPNQNTSMDERELTIPLVPGRNKIQVSVMNQQGTESLRQTVYTVYSAKDTPQDLYMVAIGVSQYQNPAYNLRFAAKDAQDMIQAYQAPHQPWSNIHVLSLTDDRAIREEILKAKIWLMQSRVHDLVIVFAAGHGMTDEAANYYFGTYDINADIPASKGLPYEEFEFLLDGIPALKKVLLLDTCFSGEIENDAPILVKETQSNVGQTGQVVMRAFKPIRGISLVPDTGSKETVERLSPEVIRFQQDWFADLRRGTGAAVISSSSGNEYSLEGPQWGNGVFTYALLQGLKNRQADTNTDQRITVSELQSYVIDQVRELTQGGQNPTVRHQNLEYDFAIY
jgi:WD40 repeat protein